MKKFLLLCFILSFALPVFSKPGTIVTYTIDPEKNAYLHNNKGIECASEKDYYCAIQEFKIAISLNPQKQSTAVYFNNLGKTYMTIGYPQLAVDCFENAMTQYSLNFEYYKNLVDCYKTLGISGEKLADYQVKSETNPFDKIIVALLEEQRGNIRKAIITLDEFTTLEPDLLITPAIKNYTKELVEKIK